MKCLACEKEVTKQHGNGLAYCEKCMKDRHINTQTYSYTLGGFIDDYKTYKR